MIGGNGYLSPNLKLSDIAYVGAHNCAQSTAYGWVYAQQNVTVTEQYEKYGARHFKLPLHWYKYNGTPDIALAHEEDGEGNCKVTLVQRALRDPERAKTRMVEFYNLAVKYPQEVFVLKLESKLGSNSKTNGTEGWDKNQVAQALHNLLVDTKIQSRAIAFQGLETPTLGWCRQNNKQILITIEPGNYLIGELANYTHYSYNISAQVDWEQDPLKQVTNGDVRRGLKNGNTIQSPFLEVHFNPENSAKFNSQYKDTYNAFQNVRKRFLAFNFHCKKMPNFLVSDCIDQGDLANVVDQVNKIVNDKGGQTPDMFMFF